MFRTITILLAIVFALSCIQTTSASDWSCIESIAENSVSVATYGGEVTGGDAEAIGSFASAMHNICTGCGKSCSFLNELSSGSTADAIGCVSGLVEAIAEGGDGLDDAITDCGSLTQDAVAVEKMLKIYNRFIN